VKMPMRLLSLVLRICRSIMFQWYSENREEPRTKSHEPRQKIGN